MLLVIPCPAACSLNTAQSFDVGVDIECLDVYQQLTLGRKTREVIFPLSEDNTEIIVEKKGALTST